jgi:hypothetical protein
MLTETATRTPLTLVVRTATSRCQCPCARPLLGYRAVLVNEAGETIEISLEPLPSRESADGWASDYLDDHPVRSANVRIVPEANPDYQAQCLSVILPGERYIADAENRIRYCLRCGISRAAASRGLPS